MKFRVLLALCAAAALVTGCNQRSDQQLLTELNKLTDPPNSKTEKSDEAARKKRAEQARELLKEFESNYPQSPLLNEARAQALKAMTLTREPADGAAEVARNLRDRAPKGSDFAAQGDLFLALRELQDMFKGLRDEEHIKNTYYQNASTIRARVEGLLTTYPKYRPAANLAAQVVQLADAADDAKTRRLILDLVAKNQPTHALARVAEREQFIGKEFTFAFTPVGADRKLSIQNLRGKVVVLDFWATWCAPCRAEMPKLKALYEKYQAKGLEIIGVSLDRDEDELTKYVKAQALRWPQAVGPDARGLAEQWGVEGIPAVFVLDRQGRLHTLNGRGKLEKLVPELLGAR